MKKIIYGIAFSLSFTSFVFASSGNLINESKTTFKVTPPEFCCVSQDVWAGNENLGNVTSCAGTCEQAQNNWESTRQAVLKAYKERETSLD